MPISFRGCRQKSSLSLKSLYFTLGTFLVSWGSIGRMLSSMITVICIGLSGYCSRYSARPRKWQTLGKVSQCDDALPENVGPDDLNALMPGVSWHVIFISSAGTVGWVIWPVKTCPQSDQSRERHLTFAGHCYRCEDQPVKHLVLWEGTAGRMLRGQAH